jgi:phytoene/squalene synthetase
VSQDIQQHIVALHERLAPLDGESLEPRTRELLLVLLSDLTRLLGPPPLDDEEHPLTDRLEELAARFDAEHPSVSNAVRQLIDALAKAGI